MQTSAKSVSSRSRKRGRRGQRFVPRISVHWCAAPASMGSPRAQAALWAGLVREAVALTSSRTDQLDELGAYDDARISCAWLQQSLPTFQIVSRSWTGTVRDFVQFSLDAKGDVKVACSNPNARLHDFVLDPPSDEDAQLRARDLVQTAIRLLVPTSTEFDGADE